MKKKIVNNKKEQVISMKEARMIAFAWCSFVLEIVKDGAYKNMDKDKTLDRNLLHLCKRAVKERNAIFDRCEKIALEAIYDH